MRRAGSERNRGNEGEGERRLVHFSPRIKLVFAPDNYDFFPTNSGWIIDFSLPSQVQWQFARRREKKKNREISFPPNEIFIRLDAITATSNFCFTIVVLRVLRYTGGIKSRRGERNFARGMDSKSVKRQSRRSSPGSACLPACLPAWPRRNARGAPQLFFISILRLCSRINNAHA